MTLSKKLIPAVAAAALYSTPALAQDYNKEDWLKTPVCELSGNVSLKTAYITADGFVADNDGVIQASITAGCEKGYYASAWVNAPLTDQNPSDEIDWTIGKVSEVIGGELNTSVSIFDIKNPDLFDFEGDLISPSTTFTKNNFYGTVDGYFAKGGNGYALEAGITGEANLGDINVNYSVGPRYVNGPFNNPEITFIDSSVGISTKHIPNVSLGIQGMTVLDKQDSDSRHSAVSFGITYSASF